MHVKTILQILISSLILAGCLATGLPELNPNSPYDGPSLEEITINNKHLLVAKVDSTKYQLQIIENSQEENAKTIEELHQEKQSLLSFNGSFFDTDFKPLGLLVSGATLLAPLNKSSLMNGIMTINQKGQAKLYSYDQFQENQQGLLPDLDIGIQAGPILLDEQGQIAIDQSNSIIAGRTALGLDKDNNVVILMMRQSLLDRENALTLYDFANLASSDPQFMEIGLHSLLNLDGGNSSGLAWQESYYPELSRVQNIIITKKRAS